MWSKLQCFMVGGIVSGVYALALFLFLWNPFWFLGVGVFCFVYFMVVVFLALFFNLSGIGFEDL